MRHVVAEFDPQPVIKEFQNDSYWSSTAAGREAFSSTQSFGGCEIQERTRALPRGQPSSRRGLRPLPVYPAAPTSSVCPSHLTKEKRRWLKESVYSHSVPQATWCSSAPFFTPLGSSVTSLCRSHSIRQPKVHGQPPCWSMSDCWRYLRFNTAWWPGPGSKMSLRE